MKRTYQPSNRRRRRKHGFRARMQSVAGRAILKRRRAKGRKRLAVWVSIGDPKKAWGLRRLCKRSEFLQVYRQGKSVHTRTLVLYFLRNDGENHRIGITASRKIGKAVVRNGIKRAFREIFRNYEVLMPPMDFVVNAKKPSASASFAELREDYLSAIERVTVKQEGKWRH